MPKRVSEVYQENGSSVVSRQALCLTTSGAILLVQEHAERRKIELQTEKTEPFVN